MSLSSRFLAKTPARTPARFDGALVWGTLHAAHKAKIGAVALELFVNQIGEDVHCIGEPSVDGRPFEAAGPLLNDMLTIAISDALEAAAPALFEALSDDASPVPIPSLLGAVCRRCGCSEQDACETGCHWVEQDLCSACRNA